jgi:Uncharacterised protein family (UPF0175)
MDVTLHIPDEFAQRLKAAGGDLSRRALEALALEEYKLGHLTTAELRGLLGLGTPADMDGFLKAHGVSGTAMLDDQKRERQDLAHEAAQAIREMSKGVTLGGLKIKDLINEGRL